MKAKYSLGSVELSQRRVAKPYTRPQATIKRTKMDVLLFMLAESLGPITFAAFKRDVLPHFPLGPEAGGQLSEEEYQLVIEQARRELPHFLKWLLDQNLGLSKTPGFVFPI